MDLDVIGGSVETLKKNGYKILNDKAFLRKLQSFNIAGLKINDPEKAKHTETTQRFRLRIVKESGEELASKVEFSRRKLEEQDAYISENINSEIARAYKQISFFTQHYKGEYAFLQKVKALAGRAQVQVRDIFDIFILDLAAYCDKTLIQKLEIEILEKAQEELLSISYKDYQGQVLEFLDDNHRKEFGSPEFFKSLQERVLELISL